MNKKREQEEKKVKDIPAEVADWLSRVGYPLEMRTARAFKKSGFRVIQSEMYLAYDPKIYERIQREVDVVASLTEPLRDYSDLVLTSEYRAQNEGVLERHTPYQGFIRKYLSFFVVSECKFSVDSSWAVFTTSDMPTTDDTPYVCRIQNAAARKLLADARKAGFELPAFRYNGRMGYSIKATTEGAREDRAYDATAKVKEASKALFERYETNINADEGRCRFFFPVVVVEGKLFDVHLNPQDEVEIEETNWVSLALRDAAEPKANSLIIDVVSSEHLNEYVSSIETTFESLLTGLLYHESNLLRRSLGLDSVSHEEVVRMRHEIKEGRDND